MQTPWLPLLQLGGQLKGHGVGVSLMVQTVFPGTSVLTLNVPVLSWRKPSPPSPVKTPRLRSVSPPDPRSTLSLRASTSMAAKSLYVYGTWNPTKSWRRQTSSRKPVERSWSESRSRLQVWMRVCVVSGHHTTVIFGVSRWMGFNFLTVLVLFAVVIIRYPHRNLLYYWPGFCFISSFLSICYLEANGVLRPIFYAYQARAYINLKTTSVQWSTCDQD